MTLAPTAKEVTVGNPATADFQPPRDGLFRYLTQLELTIALAANAGAVFFEDGEADLPTGVENDIGFVLDDGAASGVYRKGASSWAKTAELPLGFGDMLGALAAVEALTLDDISEGTTGKSFTQALKTKLEGIADDATKNSTDAALRDRGSHTGEQAIDTITGLQSALNGKATAAQGTDSREWTGATVSQAEAEAGIATTRRAWTAERIFQAVAAWWAASAAKVALDAATAAIAALGARIDRIAIAEITRPGEAPEQFSSSLTGAPEDRPAISGGAVQVDDRVGAVYAVPGAGIIAPRRAYALEADRLYRLRVKFIRITNSSDPSGDAVEVKWRNLNKNKATVSTATLETYDDPKFDDEPQELSVLISRDSGNADAEYMPPATARYGTPFIETFGDTPVTGIVFFEWQDVTDIILGGADVADVRADLTTEVAARAADTLSIRNNGSVIELETTSADPGTITADLPDGFTSLSPSTGTKYLLAPSDTNTGPVTLEIFDGSGNSVRGPLPVFDADGNELEAGEFLSTRRYPLRLSGAASHFRIVSAVTSREVSKIGAAAEVSQDDAFRASMWTVAYEADPDETQVPRSITEDGWILRYTDPATGEDLATEAEFRAAMWQILVDAEDGPVPRALGEDGGVVVQIEDGVEVDLVAAEAAFRRAMWQVVYADDGSEIEVYLALAEDGGALATAPLTDTGDAGTAANLAPYISSGELWVTGGKGPARLLNSAATWVACQPHYKVAVGVRSDGEARAVGESGNVYWTFEISIITADGQSNGEGQAHLQVLAEAIYDSNPWPARYQTLEVNGGDDVWLGLTTGGAASTALNGSDVTGYVPLRSQVIGTYGTNLVEAAVRAILADAETDTGYVPRVLVWSNAEGGQNINNLLEAAGGDPSTYHGFENIVTALTRAQALKPAWARLVYRWMLINQGESNTGTSNLGDLHDQYRSEVEAQAQSILGQSEPLRALTFQPSSFESTAAGVISILAYCIANAGDRLIFCAGPTYWYAWSDDFLHHPSAAHAKSGELCAAAMQLIENGETWLPLYVVSATVTGANEVTVTFSEDVEEATTDVVTAISNLGMQLIGATISGYTLSGDTAVLTTSNAASGATELRLGMSGQTDPRTEAAVPRTNIRSLASYGTHGDGDPIKKWLCHDRVTIS